MPITVWIGLGLLVICALATEIWRKSVNRWFWSVTVCGIVLGAHLMMEGFTPENATWGYRLTAAGVAVLAVWMLWKHPIPTQTSTASRKAP